MKNPMGGSSKSTDPTVTLTVVTEKWVSRGKATISQQNIMQLTDVVIAKEQVTTEGNFIPLPTNDVIRKPVGHMEITNDET
jgi:hypothetical protein